MTGDAANPQTPEAGAAPRSDLRPEHIVEAALFSAGRPVSVQEIQDETGLPEKQIKAAIKALVAAYKERDTALEVGPAGAKWAMQVRSMVSGPAARFAPMEIPKKVLKTLALIAYHQPLKQSDLKDMIGSKVYDHVGELVERGLVRARPDGVTKRLTTTPQFPEYFGIPGEDMEAIRGQMAALVGLPPPEKKPDEAPHNTPRALEEFAQAALAAAQEEAVGQAAADQPASPATDAATAAKHPLAREEGPRLREKRLQPAEESAAVLQVPTPGEPRRGSEEGAPSEEEVEADDGAVTAEQVS